MILLEDEHNTMSGQPLSKKALDTIYSGLLDNLKRSGLFDEMRVSIIDPMWKDPSFEEIVKDFERQCDEFCKNIDLSKNRRELRAALDRCSENSQHRLLEDHIRNTIEEMKDQITSKFNEYARDYLRKEYQQTPNATPAETPNESTATPMELDEDVERPAFSPISEHGNEATNHIDGADIKLANSPQAPSSQQPQSQSQKASSSNQQPLALTPKIEQSMTTEATESRSPFTTVTPTTSAITQPALEDIPMPLEDYQEEDEIPTPVHDEIPPTPVRDEPTRDDDDDLDLQLSPISSVHTNNLSDFEDSINLSEDEANVVGRPKNSRIKLDDLAATINEFETKSTAVKCEIEQEPSEELTLKKSEPTQTESRTSVKSEPDSLNNTAINPPLGETSESDACSEITTSSRRAARQRKSNPRYSNEHFTS